RLPVSPRRLAISPITVALRRKKTVTERDPTDPEKDVTGARVAERPAPIHERKFDMTKRFVTAITVLALVAVLGVPAFAQGSAESSVRGNLSGIVVDSS